MSLTTEQVNEIKSELLLNWDMAKKMHGMRTKPKIKNYHQGLMIGFEMSIDCIIKKLAENNTEQSK